MSVNLTQYQVTVGICNNQKLSRNMKIEELPIRKWSNNLFKFISTLYRKLGMFYKIFKSKSLQHLFKLIPEERSSYFIRNTSNIRL